MKYLIILLFYPFFSWSQVGINFKLWVEFNDKGNVNDQSYTAKDLLSERAIARREKQHIPLHFTDLPIQTEYVESLNKLGFLILNKSKWFNGVIVLCPDTQLIDTLTQLSFVKHVDTLGYDLTRQTSRMDSKLNDIVFENDYGNARNQIEMIGGLSLHEQGYQGQDIHIAVLDAGFGNAYEIDGLNHLFASQRILGTWNYVDNGPSVFGSSSHGMLVLSTMGGFLKNEFIGTAPQASYWLFKTEDPNSETRLEEYNWAIAAEFADSAGVDIINSSLSYSTFDVESQNYTYHDLDGKTSLISRAAVLAARKGMIVCSSAGNYGNDNWKYIGAPADADSILTVGSVDENRTTSSFSSFGPTADDRIKPTVSAQGTNAAILTSSNSVGYSNGTSFSSPIIAGMTACLWQAHYDKTNIEIINAITQSAHLYQTPDNQMGYGIPNFSLANALLLDIDDINTPSIDIFPNPTYSQAIVSIYSGNESDLSYRLVDLRGNVVLSGDIEWLYSNVSLKIPQLESGIYLLEVKTQRGTMTERLSILH